MYPRRKLGRGTKADGSHGGGLLCQAGLDALFYDHEDIDEIEGYILSAQELILREESEQSASELMHALIVADFLRGIQSFDMPNLF